MNPAHREIEVKYMVSGNHLCRVTAETPEEVKLQVCALTGIPVKEQYLCWDEGSQDGETTMWLVRTKLQNRFTSRLEHHPELSEIQGAFTFVKRISNDNSEVSVCHWGSQTVVRKISRKDTATPDDALAEIAIMSFLCGQPDMPEYILRMLGAFEDEKCTWLVTEYAEGGDLFALAANSSIKLNEDEIRRYVWQLLQAVQYLHAHRIGHRDISLENILLLRGSLRLMDFGMAVQSHSEDGEELRYYDKVGKDNYRAPECYREGGDGYAVQPADVFSAGVCSFILAFRVPPWTRAVTSDGCFRFVALHGLEALVQTWSLQPVLDNVGFELLRAMLMLSDRPSAAACLVSSWFSVMSSST